MITYIFAGIGFLTVVGLAGLIVATIVDMARHPLSKEETQLERYHLTVERNKRMS